MAAWSRFALPDSDCESVLDSDGSEGSHDEDSSSDEELDDEWAISEILGAVAASFPGGTESCGCRNVVSGLVGMPHSVTHSLTRAQHVGMLVVVWFIHMKLPIPVSQSNTYIRLVM